MGITLIANGSRAPFSESNLKIQKSGLSERFRELIVCNFFFFTQSLYTYGPRAPNVFGSDVQ